EALTQARTVMDSAAGDVREQLETRLRTLTENARTTAEELQALVDGRPDDAGRTRDLAQNASQHIGRLADRADDLGIQGVVEEVSDLARRRPVLFLAGAATAGLLVGRMARAGKESQASDPSATDAPAVARPEPATPDWGRTDAAIPAVAPVSPIVPGPSPVVTPATPGVDPITGSAGGVMG
ncbi:MAG: hypothetical protein ACRDZ2_06400, partial [Ilumatobacteraceae bacterium]